MSQFNVGDKIRSDEYGMGEVVAFCSEKWLNVQFTGSSKIRTYDRVTGLRQSPNGTDSIRLDNHVLRIGMVITSPFKGMGKVIGNDCIAKGYVDVKFDSGLELIYDPRTGRRHPVCGDDYVYPYVAPKKKYIRKSRAMYVKGRRIVSLDDLYRQKFVMWGGKVYNEGWTHAWQMKMAFDAIFSTSGIWVAQKKEKNND